MSKEPAFLFYPNDWLGGTMYLTFEQKGCYLDLLLMQVANGKFTESQAKQVLNNSFSNVWDTLKPKFITDGTYYWNEKMYKVLEARKSFTESRRNNRLGKTKKITSVKRKKKTSKTLEELVGNGNGIEKRKLDFFEDAKKLFGDSPMTTKFCEYWTEHSPDSLKMRYEFEKVFDMNRRFKTWTENNKKFNNNGTKPNTPGVAEKLETGKRAGTF